MRHIIDVRKSPLISVEIDGRRPTDGPITGIRFGEGRIVVNNEKSILSERRQLCMVLASLGLENMQIADFTYTSVNTIKTHISQALTYLPIASRMGFGRYAQEADMYEIVTGIPSLGLLPTEIAVIDHLSWGNNNKEIADNLDIPVSRVETALGSVRRKTGLVKREDLALSSLMSGEIGRAAGQALGNDLELPMGQPSPMGIVTLPAGVSLANFVEGAHQQIHSFVEG